jgi:rhodanese-related sulfurtransferase
MQIIEIKKAIQLLKDQKQNLAFLDIRERKHYVQGFAFGTINCPLSKFKTTIKNLVPDHHTTILLIGFKNTAQIKKVKSVVKSLNYKNVFQIKGDYKNWKKAKLPFWAGEYTFSKAFGEWIEITSEVNNLFPKQLKTIHQKPHNYLQVDARPKKEFEKFTLPQSVQCSGGELPCFINNQTNLKKDYIVHCAGRTRSIVAYQTLKDFNFKNKKYVLNGGTQNWVLNGFERELGKKSKIKLTKIHFKKDLKLAKQIAKKFKIPSSSQKNKGDQFHYFQLNSEIKDFKKIKGWKQVNATTLVQNTDKFIASTQTKIFIFSNIPTSAVFATVWLRRMGYNAIWQIKNPASFKKSYSITKPDPTYFFPQRHLGNKAHSRGYLNWEHSLIPTIRKWGCKQPWVSANQKNLKEVKHTIYKVYKNF